MVAATVFGPGSRAVGEVQGGTLVLRRRFDRHFFFKYQGYGVSESVLDQSESCGARDVVIVETYKGRVTRYRAPLAAFRHSALVWTFVLRNGTWDRQRFVHRSMMEVVK